MDPVSILLELLLSCATVGAVAALVVALRQAELRRWIVPLAVLVALAGIPGVLAPILSLSRLRALAGFGSLIIAAWLSLLAHKRWRDYGRARATIRTANLADTAALGERGAAEVSVGGRLCGAPPLLGPVSGKPCVFYRLEVHRGPPGGHEELVALEESGAERLVLRDERGQLALEAAATHFRPRGSKLNEAVAQGEVDADQLISGEPDSRLAALVRKLDPDPPEEGRLGYRLVERALAEETPVYLSGKLMRREGELALMPLGARLLLASDAKDLARKQRAGALKLTAAAVLAVACGALWLARS